MNGILAIDTVSPRFAVAFGNGAQTAAIVEREALQDHSRLLLSAIEEVLGGEKSAVTSVVVITGPGSYAGVRVGVATAQGLAFALGVPIFGVGTLEAVAQALVAPSTELTIIHPSGRGEFAAQPWREGKPCGPLGIADAEALRGLMVAGEGAAAFGGEEVGPSARVLSAMRLVDEQHASGPRPEGADVTYLREPKITVSRRNPLTTPPA